jgi:hypothetical protein
MYNASIQLAPLLCSNQESATRESTATTHTTTNFFRIAVIANRPDADHGSPGSELPHYARQSIMTARNSHPCSSLPDASQRIRCRPLVLLIVVAALSLFDLPRVIAAEETETQTTATPAAPSPESAVQPPEAAPPDTIEDGPCLKHRYPQDPTGARARLGMCRRGEHGQGGRHRRPHGGPWWNQP